MVISRCVAEVVVRARRGVLAHQLKHGHRFAKKFAASSWRSTVLLAIVVFAGCSSHSIGSHESQSLTPAGAVAVREGVRAFMQRVAVDVTQDGPLAWCKYLDTSPVFFMAVNGQMAFPNGAAAQEGTQKFAQTINHIQLKWGDDLRVDPLLQSLPSLQFHGAKSNWTPKGIASTKLDTLPDSPSIGKSAGNCATHTGRPRYPHRAATTKDPNRVWKNG